MPVAFRSEHRLRQPEFGHRRLTQHDRTQRDPVIAHRRFQVRQAISRVNAALAENIAGVRVIQGLNRQDENMRRFDALNRNHLDLSTKAAQLSASVQPMVEVLMAVAIALVVVMGASMVLHGQIKIEETNILQSTCKRDARQVDSGELM